mmetsp:Transcript_14013/g.45731  ORF Transcript_14013/g.45731 Transcript_14013/m.45731 type:complete len:137 (+) Transcript_14013:1116-1526(+)
MLEGIRTVLDVANAANGTFGDVLRFPLPNSTLEETLERSLQTYYHPVGTARMGDDDNAVVGFDLKVTNVRGLRVVDNSIVPLIPNANTNPCAMIIGYHGADLILEEPNPIAPCPAACHPQKGDDNNTAASLDCSAC